MSAAALKLPAHESSEATGSHGAALADAAMAAALEHVPAAAFVLDSHLQVVHANAVGRHRLNEQGSEMRLALAHAARGEHPPHELVVTTLAGAGWATRYLVVSRAHADRVRFAIERAKARYQLTAREIQVLAEIAAGRTNRNISETLGLAPRTVELHVSSLLRKARANSRSQLILDLWHLADRGTRTSDPTI